MNALGEGRVGAKNIDDRVAHGDCIVAVIEDSRLSSSGVGSEVRYQAPVRAEEGTEKR